MMKNAVEEKAYENQEAYQRTQMQKDMILERLREQGCRITRQRQLILDIILEEECSCCKEIYYKVQEKDRNIGPATIYRMVNMLEKIGAISRKNMYRISSCAACCQENGCTVRLSDATVCKLPSEVWKQVVREGLKNMGYIGDQDIESIEMTMSKCRCLKTGSDSMKAYKNSSYPGERVRACLKKHSRNLHAPLCGIFHSNCDVHLAESFFKHALKQGR